MTEIILEWIHPVIMIADEIKAWILMKWSGTKIRMLEWQCHLVRNQNEPIDGATPFHLEKALAKQQNSPYTIDMIERGYSIIIMKRMLSRDEVWFAVCRGLPWYVRGKSWIKLWLFRMWRLSLVETARQYVPKYDVKGTYIYLIQS